MSMDDVETCYDRVPLVKWPADLLFPAVFDAPREVRLLMLKLLALSGRQEAAINA